MALKWNCAPVRFAGKSATGKGLGGGSRWGAPYHVQFMVLLSRAIRVRRFQALSKQDIAQFLIVGVHPSAPSYSLETHSRPCSLRHVLETSAAGSF